MKKIYTEQDYIDKCLELNDEFCGTHKHPHDGTIIEYICNKHREKGIQECDWAHFRVQKTSCPYCSGRYKTTEDIIPLIKDPDVEVISEYLGNEKPIECKCRKCGNIWTTLPKVLITNGSGCPECGVIKRAMKRKKTHLQFIKDLKMSCPDVIAKSKYINSKTNMVFKCLIDGTEFEAMPSNVLNKNTKCPTCTKRFLHEKFAYTTSQVNELIKDNGIRLTGEYTSAHDLTEFECLTCKRTFKTRPSSILYKNSSCPYCSGTRGEFLLNKILESHHIFCKSQYKFQDCKYKNLLKFDFYDEENNITYEYNGEQHYFPVDFAGKGEEWAQQQFEIVQIRDGIKIDYCNKNNIPLIIIPYWEFDNMELYLDNEWKRRKLYQYSN